MILGLFVALTTNHVGILRNGWSSIDIFSHGGAKENVNPLDPAAENKNKLIEQWLIGCAE
eukprot:CAMPEP_0198153766 /NCGR_PEP_ID=MMETSP1443-20131203/65637_1 /TAXON_ID=186043 /ORGANISM="Entomoneis sp., Strain CCMP2396" /LENGTH=59 /DNA_ID=CAMNT_0043820219 /DNA_START=435 /DNA_END=611 /DNA_ORIENTATION=-